MAENVHVGPGNGGFREVSETFTDIDFSSSSEATVTISGLKRIEGPEDVTAEAYGSGDSDADEGRVVIANAVTGATVTLHEYVGGGAGAALDDGDTMDVDHVQVRARGY